MVFAAASEPAACTRDASVNDRVSQMNVRVGSADASRSRSDMSCDVDACY